MNGLGFDMLDPYFVARLYRRGDHTWLTCGQSASFMSAANDGISSVFVGGIFCRNGDIGQIPAHRIDHRGKTSRERSIVPFRDVLVGPFEVGQGFFLGLLAFQVKSATFSVEHVWRFNTFVITDPAKRMGPRQGHFLKWFRFARHEIVTVGLPHPIAKNIHFRSKGAGLERCAKMRDFALAPHGSGEDEIAAGVAGDHVAGECADLCPEWFGENGPCTGARGESVVVEPMGRASDDRADTVRWAGKTGKKCGSKRGRVDEVHEWAERSRSNGAGAMVCCVEKQRLVAWRLI